jgi:hypothetical protein
MRTRRLCGVTLTIVCIAMFGAVIAAHHSQPGFDPNDKPITLKGTVAEYRWRNPHVLLFWDVKDDSGNVVRWVGEFGSVATTFSRGMTKTTFKAGEEITVTGIPSRAGTPILQLRKIVKSDGTAVAATPE